jgi:hypothetical protein
MRQFRIDDSERDRILNLHENATKRQYLKEQGEDKGPELKDIEGYNENAEIFLKETGSKTFTILSSSQGSFIFNGNIVKEGGDKVTLTPQTNIKIKPYLSGGDGKTEMSGNLILHTPDKTGFQITYYNNNYKIIPTA